MSDLISRKKIRDYIKGEINPYGKPFEGTAYELGLKIIRYIDAMDSDYDVEKVVEELKQKKEEVQRMRNTCVSLADLEVCDIENVTYERAIEIVKQGGVSDDVCEWKFEETNGVAWHCNGKCTTYNQAYVKDLKITLEDFECKCHYCGKKIKVVE